jgi:hypothetical protein
MLFLVAGPVIGLAIGTGAGSLPAAQQPPSPPLEPPPGGSWSGGVFVKI